MKSPKLSAVFTRAKLSLLFLSLNIFYASYAQAAEMVDLGTIAAGSLYSEPYGISSNGMLL